jgi:hypothetical protein
MFISRVSVVVARQEEKRPVIHDMLMMAFMVLGTAFFHTLFQILP